MTGTIQETEDLCLKHETRLSTITARREIYPWPPVTSRVKRPASAVVSHIVEVGVVGSATQVDQKFLSKTVGECYSVTVMFSLAYWTRAPK